MSAIDNGGNALVRIGGRRKNKLAPLVLFRRIYLVFELNFLSLLNFRFGFKSVNHERVWNSNAFSD